MDLMNVLGTSRQVRKPINNGFGYEEQVITYLSYPHEVDDSRHIGQFKREEILCV